KAAAAPPPVQAQEAKEPETVNGNEDADAPGDGFVGGLRSKAKAPSKGLAAKKRQAVIASTTDQLNAALDGRVANSNYQQYSNQIDPNAMVQTGPGLPHWSWRTIPLRWSGPVEHGQRLHLYWLSPATGCLLAILRVLLLAFLLVRLGGLDERFFPRAPWL